MSTAIESTPTMHILKWLAEGTLFSYQPGQVIIAWGDPRRAEVPDCQDSPWFYFPDYFLENADPWIHYSQTEIIPIEDLIKKLEDIAPHTPTPMHWESPQKEPFETGFHDLQRLFSETPLEKAVLYTFSKSGDRFSPPHRHRALIHMLRTALTAPVFVYGFWDQSQGILGATPELLFRLEHGDHSTTLRTMALAGTQKNDKNPMEMLQDKKLMHEHQIVVDDIVSQLSDLGTVIKEPLQVMTLPHLSHLYTPITVEVDPGITFWSFVRKLHPTPALGGFPRDLAWSWLGSYNNTLPREYYGAPVGYHAPHNHQSACYVAIRNIFWNEEDSTIAAGCGIIKESNLEEEWEEILLKTTAIKRMLCL